MLATVLTGLAEGGTTDQKYRFEAVYTADLLRNVSGGRRQGGAHLDNLDATLELGLPSEAGVRERLFFYGLYNNGTQFAETYAGDLQVTSNIDAPESWRLFEAWYEYKRGSWSALTGLYDLNSEFDVNDTGGLFLNSAHGIGSEFGQTGENGPSIFPVSSFAVRAAFETPRYTARLALLDGTPGNPDDPSSNEVKLSDDEGLLMVAEIGVKSANSGRIWAGYWRYSADFESPLGESVSAYNDGWYAGIEQDFGVVGRQASWFLRYGRTEESFNVLRAYVGAGVVVAGLLSSRPKDSVGLAVASGLVGELHRRLLTSTGRNADSHETAWEFTYRIYANDRIAVQPNIQYVQNPGATQGIDSSLIIGLRFEISY